MAGSSTDVAAATAPTSSAEDESCTCMSQQDLRLFASSFLKAIAPGTDDKYPDGAIVCVAKDKLLANHPAAPAPKIPSSSGDSAKDSNTKPESASATPAQAVMAFSPKGELPNFSRDPSFVSKNALGQEIIAEATESFAFISTMSLEDSYKAEQYVGQLKSFRSPTESQRQDLEKKYPSIFATFSDKVEPSKVLAFLSKSNPYAPFDAYDAIARIIEESDKLVALTLDSDAQMLPDPTSSASAAGAASQATQDAAATALTDAYKVIADNNAKIRASSTNIAAQVGKLSGSLNNILGGSTIGQVIAEYIKARRGQQPIPLMLAGDKPTDIPKPAGYFVWPFLAKVINYSLEFWRGRVTADGRDAAEIAVTPLKIHAQPGAFTDLESLKGKVGFWATQRFRSPAYNALYGRSIHDFYKLLDEEYLENVAKGNNFSMYSTAMRFGHPLTIAPAAGQHAAPMSELGKRPPSGADHGHGPPGSANAGMPGSA